MKHYKYIIFCLKEKAYNKMISAARTKGYCNEYERYVAIYYFLLERYCKYPPTKFI